MSSPETYPDALAHAEELLRAMDPHVRDSMFGACTRVAHDPSEDPALRDLASALIEALERLDGVRSGDVREALAQAAPAACLVMEGVA